MIHLIIIVAVAVMIYRWLTKPRIVIVPIVYYEDGRINEASTELNVMLARYGLDKE